MDNIEKKAWNSPEIQVLDVNETAQELQLNAFDGKISPMTVYS